MGSAIDLTLGCSTQVPKGYPSDNVNPKVYPGGYLESLRKAKEYLCSLEDERRKVEGFKRELPVSIKLLEDAIQAFKEKLASEKDMPTLQLSCSSMDSEKERCKNSLESRPTLKEFLPLKRRWGAVQKSEAGSDGVNDEPERIKWPAWMTEVRLWNRDSTATRACHEEKEKEHVDLEQSCVTSSQLPFGSDKEKASTGAFLPFLKELPDATAPSLVSRPTPTMAHSSGVGLSLPVGDLMTSPGSSSKAASDIGPEAGSVDVAQIGLKDVGAVSNLGTSGGDGSSSTKSKARKARRCWAPELHRRFVSALHQLGGAEVATPKQICELMKVDGLTNDEVKSHLQKYRLHTRRPGSASPQVAAGAQSTPQLVVLGGIWMPPKCPQVPSAGVNRTSGAAAAPVQMHRQPSSHEPQQAPSQSQSSPQGSVQVTSQFSEATQGPNSEVYRTDDDSGEEEEAKSDSTSWKNGSHNAREELKKPSSECTSN